MREDARAIKAERDRLRDALIFARTALLTGGNTVSAIARIDLALKNSENTSDQ